MTSPSEHTSSQDLGSLFEETWYLEQYPDVRNSGMTPLSHYLEIGDAVGYRPLPLFDPAFYSFQHPELARQGGERLGHYAESGERLGVLPSALFDPLFYRRDNPDLEGLQGTLLGHYHQHGASEMRSPNPLFAAAWYCDQTDGGENAWINPLVHYIESGDHSGLSPHPLFDPDYYGSQHIELPQAGGARLAHYLSRGGGDGSNPHPLFRSHFYIEQCPEWSESAITPLDHYLAEGEARGLLPNALFDPLSYRHRSRDLSGIDSSLIHYVNHGAAEGRLPNPLFSPDFYREQIERKDVEAKDLLSHYLEFGDALDLAPHPLFDPSFYCEQFPDVPGKEGSRLGHYCEYGDRSGFDPHRLFDSTYYVSQLRGPRTQGETLLCDYLAVGELQGLRPNRLFDPVHYAKQASDFDRNSSSLLEHYSRWGGAAGLSPSPLFDSTWVSEQIPLSYGKSMGPLEYYFVVRGNLPKGPHPVFSPTWYETEYSGALDSELDPLSHFMEIGAAKGFDPHPLFNSRWYRDFYGDVMGGEDSEVESVSIFHYLEFGEAQGLLPNSLFDPTYYLTHYGVELRYGERALSHFCRMGIEEGYRPSRLFSFCLQFFRDRKATRRDRAVNPAGGFFMGEFSEMTAPEAEMPIHLPPVYHPDISIIIPVHGQLIYTLACLRSLSRAENQHSFEVILVDDHSPVEEFQELTAIRNLRIVRNEEQLGFLHSCNRGAEVARGSELVFLNNDTLVTDEWLDHLVETRKFFPEAGLIGSQLIFPDGRLQEAGSIVFNDGSALNYGYGEDHLDPRFTFARVVDYVSAAAVLIAADLFRDLAGFDEIYAPAFYEDTDLAFRIREAGMAVVYQPASRVIHFGGASHGRDISSPLKRYQVVNSKIFSKRWENRLLEHLAPGSPVDQGALRLCGAGALVIDATMLTPDRDSGSLRMFNLLQVLRQLGYAVSFMPSNLDRGGEYAERLQRAGIRVICTPHAQSIERFLEKQGGDFDLCIVSRPDTAAACLDSVRLLCPQALILYDTVDLHFLRRERELRLTGVAPAPDSIRGDELKAVARADGTLTVSEYDQEQLLERVPGASVHVVSNIHHVHPHATPFSERDGILFIGSFVHTPNVDAILWFINDILPALHSWIPDLRVHVIGADPPDEVRDAACDHVIIEGFLENVDVQFSQRRLSIAPLRYGSGVKGKINQSMAHGLPCVATAVAAEGMNLDWETEILVADSALDFAEAVAELYENQQLWTEISRNSTLSIERSFSMEVASEGFRKLLQYHGRQISET